MLGRFVVVVVVAVAGMVLGCCGCPLLQAEGDTSMLKSTIPMPTHTIIEALRFTKHSPFNERYSSVKNKNSRID
ncbi:hypothetical protein KSF_104470 [Reticulibacter mediterranei]|uniref:Uncharacterized protein n=1 Tax=Reticulibacter mediterranei TaxID=2778369 RepID=A0A8J3IYR6_9CHLR|nr:hypothetical protein KSF_104470 [Reticulibacter mediterranei]